MDNIVIAPVEEVPICNHQYVIIKGSGKDTGTATWKCSNVNCKKQVKSN